MENYNPAYLLATLDQLRSVITVNAPKFEGDFFSFALKKYDTLQMVKFSAKSLAKTISYGWKELKPRVNSYQTLMGLPPSDSLEHAACFLFTHNAICDWISWAELEQENTRLRYRLGSVVHTVDTLLPNINLADTKDAVVGAQAVLAGYQLRDYVGSHYSVVDPLGREYAIMAPGPRCDCRHYTPHTGCTHTNLGRLMQTNRGLFVRAGLLEFVSGGGGGVPNHLHAN